MVQIFEEFRQIKRLKRDTAFLRNLTNEIPHLVKELTELSTRVSERRQQSTERLDDVARVRTQLYRDKETLVTGEFQSRTLRDIDRAIKRVKDQENIIDQEIRELNTLLDEIDKQTNALFTLQDNSKNVIKEMISKLRVDFIQNLESGIEELRQQQDKLKEGVNSIVGIPRRTVSALN